MCIYIYIYIYYVCINTHMCVEYEILGLGTIHICVGNIYLCTYRCTRIGTDVHVRNTCMRGTLICNIFKFNPTCATVYGE